MSSWAVDPSSLLSGSVGGQLALQGASRTILGLVSPGGRADAKLILGLVSAWDPFTALCSVTVDGTDVSSVPVLEGTPVETGQTVLMTMLGAQYVVVGQLGQVPWTPVTFLNGWVNYGGGTFNEAGYRRVGQWLEFMGLVKSGTITDPIFQTPAGYRPQRQMMLGGVSNSSTTNTASAHVHVTPNAGTRFDVRTNGEVVPAVPASNGFYSLDNVRVWLGPLP